MTRATERTDSEMHSFFHCAIMIRATQKTDSELHTCILLLSYHDRATERTDREIHSFSH